IGMAQVQALFRTAGYPERVADLLAGLCTSAAAPEFWDNVDVELTLDQRRQGGQRYPRRHLPQGAPTSPAIANLCAYRLDCRLAALADSLGATYTRYADDLAFSGDRNLARVVDRFQLHASAIALEEGFCVQHRKTRIMRQGTC